MCGVLAAGACAAGAVMTAVRICHSCGATSVEVLFAPRVRGQPVSHDCLACAADHAVKPVLDVLGTPVGPAVAVRTWRRRYRAASRAVADDAELSMYLRLGRPP